MLLKEVPDAVVIGNDRHRIKVESVERMLGGINQGGYDYEVATIGEDRKTEEAGFYHIPQGKTTRIVKIIGEVTCTEKPVQGNGWFLGQSPEGQVAYREFDENRGLEATVVYSTGCIIVWGAGDKGMRALTTSNVPFETGMEIPLEENDSRLSSEFIETFKMLQAKSSQSPG